MLVEGETDEATAKNSYDLERACSRIIKHTRVYDDPCFIRDKGVFCQIANGVNELFQFDCCYGNGTPERLYKRVPLGQRMLGKNIDAAAWQFEKVVNAGVISKDKGAAILVPAEEQLEDEQVQKSINPC